jgi:hypothetical protein
MNERAMVGLMTQLEQLRYKIILERISIYNDHNELMLNEVVIDKNKGGISIFYGTLEMAWFGPVVLSEQPSMSGYYQEVMLKQNFYIVAINGDRTEKILSFRTGVSRYE